MAYIKLFICLVLFASCRGEMELKSDKIEFLDQDSTALAIELGDTIAMEQVAFDVEEFEQKRKDALKAEVASKIIKEKKEAIKPIRVKKYPIISFEEDFYDAGQITEGEVIKHNYKFTNTGKASLEITKAVGTCGCTKPSYPFLDIAPGETGVIGVEYHSVGKNGMQDPEIYVYSNASKSKYVLKMQVDVIDDTVVESEKLDTINDVNQ